MLDFEPSEKLTTLFLKTHILLIPNNPSLTDEDAHSAAKKHITRTLDFVISNQCRYLQYKGAQSVTIFDKDGFSDVIKELLLEHIASITKEDEDAFMDMLQNEIKAALAGQSNPILERRWGILKYTNERLEADIQPRKRRDLGNVFKP